MSYSTYNREFSSISLGGNEISVKIDKSNKIIFVSTNIWKKNPSVKIEGNPHEDNSPVEMDRIFHFLIQDNLDMFKEILRIIKDSEPEYFGIGINLLNSKKAEYDKKYSL